MTLKFEMISIVSPKVQMAAYHVQVCHRNGVKGLAEIEGPRKFGREALSAVQQLARNNTPKGCRVIMRMGEIGGQISGEQIAFDLLGGEILRTTIRTPEFDPKVEPQPSGVDLKPDSDCVFCNKSIPNRTPVLKEEGVFVFEPPKKDAKEHLLFIPLIHWRDLMQVTDPDYFGAVFSKIVAISQRNEYQGGFLLESNNGPNGGQSIPHFHIHLKGGEKLPSPLWQDWQ